jgi:hypothetical protein
MELQIPEYLYSFGIFVGIINVLSALILIWLGANRMSHAENDRWNSAFLFSFIVLGWYVIAQVLGRANIYWAVTHMQIPTIQYGLVIPILVGLYGIIRMERFRRLVLAIPLFALVGVQVYRVLGGIFLVLWNSGKLPWEFAIPAGVGDILIGVLAVVIALMLYNRNNFAIRAAYLWCLFGIADLVVAITTGTLTSPGIANLLSRDNPNLFITAYPLVMIPIFAVPLSIILHVLTLWRIKHLEDVSPVRKVETVE